VTVTLFITLIAVHVAAALKHLLVSRDGVFQRMWRRNLPAPGPTNS